MIFFFLEYFFRINSQKYENTIKGSELVSWWEYLVLMELVSFYLWSEGKEWVRRSCRASFYIIYLCNHSSQCTGRHCRNGPHTQPGAFPSLSLLLLHLQGQSGVYLKVYNSRTTCQLCPCFLLVSLTPGALFVPAGSQHAAAHSPTLEPEINANLEYTFKTEHCLQLKKLQHCQLCSYWISDLKTQKKNRNQTKIIFPCEKSIATEFVGTWIWV